MLRSLYKSDLPQLLVIEHAVHVAPWTEETFKTCFRSGYIGWVIEIEQKVIGFMIVSVSLTECHILNICIAHAYQRQGWGRKLLHQVLNHARQQGVNIIYLEVRRSNTKAISLYKSMDFREIGERKNYYPTVSGNEDALIFARSVALT